jgi:hypothetical protein
MKQMYQFVKRQDLYLLLGQPEPELSLISHDLLLLANITPASLSS